MLGGGRAVAAARSTREAGDGQGIWRSGRRHCGVNEGSTDELHSVSTSGGMRERGDEGYNSTGSGTRGSVTVGPTAGV
jgi:hypothetical protein